MTVARSLVFPLLSFPLSPLILPSLPYSTLSNPSPSFLPPPPPPPLPLPLSDLYLSPDDPSNWDCSTDRRRCPSSSVGSSTPLSLWASSSHTYTYPDILSCSGTQGGTRVQCGLQEYKLVHPTRGSSFYFGKLQTALGVLRCFILLFSCPC